MFFDIHCHILPGVDDGARNEGSTRRMLDIASKEGIGAIVATPHFSCEMTKENMSEIKEKYQLVRAWWNEQNPRNELYLGNELYYSEGIIEALSEGTAMTMNGTRYVLVEFPPYADYTYIRKAVQKLLYAGYIPIIAHIERYEHLQKRAKVEELVDMGAYMQVNAAAILGSHGFMTKLFVIDLMKRQLVEFVGTDAHSSKERRPELKKCAAYLEKKLGKTRARQILVRNPRKMLRGEDVNG